MTRILITGAGGSIGGELVRELLSRSDAVICAFDSSEDALFNLETSIHLSHEKIIYASCLVTLEIYKG